MPVDAGRLGLPLLDHVHCCRAEDLLCALPDDCIDLIVTSPPYDNLRTYNGFEWSFKLIALESYRVLRPGGVMVWIVGDATIDGSETLTSFRQALYFRDVVGFRMHDTMIYQKDGSPFPESNRYWQEFEFMFVFSKGSPNTANLLTQPTKWQDTRKVKRNAVRNADGTRADAKYAIGKQTRTMANVWYVSSGYLKTTSDKIAYTHPAMFPEKLAERHILTWSNPSDIVLDFFMGSGTTAKMARNNNRHYIGCDISDEYVALARRRLALPYNLQLFAEIA